VLAQAGVEFGMIGHNGGDVASDFVDADFDQCGRVCRDLSRRTRSSARGVRQSVAPSFVTAGLGSSVRARDRGRPGREGTPGSGLTVHNCASSAGRRPTTVCAIWYVAKRDLTAMIALNEQAVPGRDDGCPAARLAGTTGLFPSCRWP